MVNRYTVGLFVVLSIAFGVYSAMQSTLELNETDGRRDWPTVPGVVDSSSAFSERGKSSTFYRVRISFRYEFEGTGYLSQQTFSTGTDSEEASRELENYPKGIEVEVWVNPDDHGEAVILPDRPRPGSQLYLAGILLGFAGLWILAFNGLPMLYRAIKNRRSGSPVPSSR